MADIIIRKAKKDYVCDVCGHIIYTGDEYLDKVVTHDGKAVRHERYHDECPYVDSAIDMFIRAFFNNRVSIAVNKITGEKFRVAGIANKLVKSVELLDWEFCSMSDIELSTFLKDYFYE